MSNHSVSTSFAPQRGTTSQPLVSYGIQCDASDKHAHVGVATRRVFVFDTRIAQQIVQRGRYRLISVGNPATAEGYAVPLRDIPGVVGVNIPPDLWVLSGIEYARTTTEQGDAAVRIVAAMIERGLLPGLGSEIWVVPPTEVELQVSGIDLCVGEPGQQQLGIQVKYDSRAGERHLGGTGNVFIQTAERNATHSY